MKQIRGILIWIIGISFIIIGALKYINLDEITKPIFENANYPKWLFHAIGAVEFTGGFLIIMTASTSRRLGSTLIGLVMIGAIVTRYMLHQRLANFLVPGAILIIAILTILNPGSEKKTTPKGT